MAFSDANISTLSVLSWAPIRGIEDAMNDSTRHRGEPDRSLVSLSQRHEIDYWTRKFGCTEQQLRRAVQAVGSSAARVEDWLRKNR